MSRLPVYLEITNRELRSIAIKKGFSKLEAENPQILHFDSLLQNEEEKRAIAIVEFLQKNYPHANGIYFNVPAQSQFLRELNLPFSTAAKVKEILPFELDSLLPIPVDETVFDFTLKPKIKEQTPNESQLSVCAVEKKALLPWLNLFSAAGFSILGMYSPVAALANTFSLYEEEDALLLHVGSAFSYLVLFEKKVPVAMRSIPLGYDIAVHKLSKRWKKSVEESEQMFRNLPSQTGLPASAYKKYFDIPKAQAKIFADTVQEFATSLANEVELTLKLSSVDVDSIPILCSSDLHEPAIIENLLRDNLAQPIAAAAYEKFPVKDPAYFLLQAAASPSPIIDWNFLTPELKKQFQGKKNKKPYFLVAMGVFGFLAFMLSYFLQIQHIKKNIEKAQKFNRTLFERMFHRKPKKIGSLSYQASRLLKKEKEKTEIFREFLDKPKFTDVLIELNRIIKTDPNMKIHEIHYANNQLNLTGTTDSFQSLSTVKKELKKAENCKEANFAREKTAPGSGGKTIVKFTLVCKIKDEA